MRFTKVFLGIFLTISGTFSSIATAPEHNNIVFRSSQAIILPQKAKLTLTSLKFPQVKAKNKRVYLYINAWIEGSSSGWYPALGLEVNGIPVGKLNNKGKPHLINRATKMKTSYKGGRDFPWWVSSKNGPLLQLFFGGKNKVDKRVTHQREEGTGYLFDITELVNTISDNTLTFKNALTTKVYKDKNKRSVIIGDIKIGYLADDETAKLTAAQKKAWRKDIKLTKSKNLQVTYRGDPLIIEEIIGSLGDPAKIAKNFKVSEKNGQLTLNAYSLGHPEIDFRREVSLDKNGILEITVRAEHKLLKPKEPRYLLYSFALPASYFEESKWTVYSGLSGAQSFSEGTFPISIPDGRLSEMKCARFLTLQKKGVDLVFDFNPYGSGTFSPYTGAGFPAGMVYSVIKKGDKVIFNFFKRNHAEMNAAKVQLYSGRDNFNERHAHNLWFYIPGPVGKKPAIYAPAFANPKQNIFKLGLNKHSFQRKVGWLNTPEKCLIFNSSNDNLFTQGVLAPQGGTGKLLIKTRPGVYLFTAAFGHPTKKIGPFNVKINGEIVAENITVEPGCSQAVDAAVYIRAPKKKMTVSISGKAAWALNYFANQTYFYQNEDFSINRGFWIDEKLPELLPNDKKNEKKITGDILSSFVLPPIKVTKGTLSKSPSAKLEVLTTYNSSGNKWMWDIKMASFNGETALNHQDDSVLRKRLNVIKSYGVNAINEQSLFFYYSHSEQWKAHRNIQKRTNAIAHELGIKVVRHVDGTVVVKKGTGPRFLLTKCIGMLKRDAQHNLPTMSSFCLNNPLFQKMFFDKLGKYVDETNADGVMVDECYFRPKNYCGCFYCRQKFEKDTASMLPLDSISKTFFDRKNLLWLRWLTWQHRAVGDFYIKLYKELRKICPDVVVMAYDNEIDMMDGARGSITISETQEARGCNAVGTEGDAVNIYGNYRNHYMFRKLTNSVCASFKRSGWALFRMNRENLDLLFLSWAMQQMNRQGEWRGNPVNAENTKMFKWQDNMPAKNSSSLANIAILYNKDLRYTNRVSRDNPLNFYDQGGVSQILTDAHIQNMFILKRDLTPAKLRKYKVLILASIETLSKKEISTIKDFVKNGGSLIVSGAPALVNNYYFPYTKNPMTELTGIVSWSSTPKLYGDLTIKMKNGLKATVKGHAWEIKPNTQTEVIGMISSSDGKKFPAVATKSIGKGKVFTSALPLGKFNFEPLYYPVDKWDFQKNTSLANILVNMVLSATQGKLPVKSVNVPEKVILEAYTNSDTNTVYVHLLNMTAKNKYVFGKPLVHGNKAKATFPALKEDLIFDISGAFSKGVAKSPDSTAHQAIKLTPLGNNLTRVTVNKEYLTRYLLLELKK